MIFDLEIMVASNGCKCKRIFDNGVYSWWFNYLKLFHQQLSQFSTLKNILQ